MSYNKNHICPAERAGGLDNRIRRLLQNPKKILKPYIQQGMTVLDVGCGPGFFSLDIAEMVGSTGKVIAADLQDAMLQKVRDKIKETEFENRIQLHKCGVNEIGVKDQVDFVLLFYMVHEIPDKINFFDELGTIVKKNKQVLIVEPPFHVSKDDFNIMINIANDAGFEETPGPGILFSKSVILTKRTI